MSDSNEFAKLIDNKLRGIIKCVVKEARANPQFAAELVATLGNDYTAYGPLVRTPAKSIINPIELLQSNNADALRDQLALLTDHELAQTIKYNKYKIAVGTRKPIDRQKLIAEIIEYATRQLNRGTSFL